MMAAQSIAPNTSAATGIPTQARQEAVWAMQLAARWLAVEPTALRAAAYRAFRAAKDDPSLPSPLAIRLLFAGWQRACEHVAALPCDEVTVEPEVVRTLYGGRRTPGGDPAPDAPANGATSTPTATTANTIDLMACAPLASQGGRSMSMTIEQIRTERARSDRITDCAEMFGELASQEREQTDQPARLFAPAHAPRALNAGAWQQTTHNLREDDPHD
jgi:hypothetical protein